MARVSATKVRQMIVVVGPALPEGFDPENVAFYNADGTAFDFADIIAGIEIPNVPSFQGEWAVDTSYPPQAIVRHEDALYITPIGASANLEPGAAVESTADSPGGSAPVGTYDRLAVGVNPDVPYVDGMARVFFDLVHAGDIVIDYDIGAGNQFGEIYDDAGASVGTAPGLGSPVYIVGLPIGRYFAGIQHAFGGSGVGDMTLELSEGAEVSGDVPSWDFMLQGVAP